MKIKKKGNILIIVLFLMLSSSALALLMTNYVLQLVNNAGELNKYVRAYYIAWGGVESELTKIKNHTFGYESNIDSGSKINENFNKGVLKNYYISGQVLSKSNVWASGDVFGLTDCSDKSKYFELKKGQGFIIPLYFDNTQPDPEKERFYGSGDSEGKITYLSNFVQDFQNIKIFSTGAGMGMDNFASGAVTFLTSGEDTYNNFEIISKNTKTFSGRYDYELKNLFKVAPDPDAAVINPDIENYLIMVSTNENTSGLAQKYCLTLGGQKLPSPITKILMQGYYGDRVVSLQVTKKTQLPEYLIYTSVQ